MKFPQLLALSLVGIGCLMVTGNYSIVKSSLTVATFTRSSFTSSASSRSTTSSASPTASSSSFIVLQNEPTSTTSTTFKKVWPGLKKQLCPAMIPQVDYGSTLFKLAREEIYMKDWTDSCKERFCMTFFRSSQGGSIYTSPEHDTIIYLDIWKGAHLQLRDWSMQTLKKTNGGECQETDLKLELVSGMAKAVRSLKEHAPSKAPCIITAIRDPVSHFIAGYNEMEYRIENGNLLQNVSAILFHRYKLGSTQRFEQFVADHLGGPKRQKWNPWIIEPGHIFSMSGVLNMLAVQGLNMTSYLPSLSNLGETWPAFVQNTCPGLPESIASTPMQLAGQHEHTNSKSPAYKAAERVMKEEGPTARALCALHAMDYACWENLPDGIPSVCIDVYTSQKFVDRINQHGKE